MGIKAHELRRLKAEKVARMRALMDGADHTTGIMAEQATTEFDQIAREVSQYDGAIQRAENLELLGRELDDIPAPANRPSPKGPSGPGTSEFENVGEFLAACILSPRDKRLDPLRNSGLSIEPRNEQSMSTGTKGGIMIPTQFREEIMQVSPQEAIFTDARVTALAAGDPPDAAIEVPALNQQAGSNMYGGVEVVWTEEGGEKGETDVDIKGIRLEPKEVAGFIFATDKLLRNWRAAGAFFALQLRMALAADRDKKCMLGSGVGTPLGIVGAPATIAVARELANKISYADLCNMEDRARDDGNLVWIASRRVRNQLRTIKDLAGQYIWAGPREGIEGVPLLGKPVLFNVRSPSLGSKGDIMLVDLKKYLVKHGSGPFIASSEHVEWKKNKTAIKAFLNVDGQPWQSGPFAEEDGQTYSGFVALDVPAA